MCLNPESPSWTWMKRKRQDHDIHDFSRDLSSKNPEGYSFLWSLTFKGKKYTPGSWISHPWKPWWKLEVKTPKLMPACAHTILPSVWKFCNTFKLFMKSRWKSPPRSPNVFFGIFLVSLSVTHSGWQQCRPAAFLENQWCRQQPNGKALVIHGGEAQVGWPQSLVLQVKWQTLDKSTRLGA